jgi:Domain of unknown function (DUF397)
MSERPNVIGKTDISRARWRKSSYSNGQSNCVEVAANLPGVVAVRDSKNPDGARLVVSPAEWRGFVADIRAGLVES